MAFTSFFTLKELFHTAVCAVVLLDMQWLAYNPFNFFKCLYETPFNHSTSLPPHPSLQPQGKDGIA